MIIDCVIYKFQQFYNFQLYEIYKKVCEKRNLLLLDLSEFTSVCSLVETKGVFIIKGKTRNRLSKVKFVYFKYNIGIILIFITVQRLRLKFCYIFISNVIYIYIFFYNNTMLRGRLIFRLYCRNPLIHYNKNFSA